MNGKLVGAMKITLLANTTPARPPIIAPMANASSLNLNVGTPISSAASSSSRIAVQARPTRLRSSRAEKMMASTITNRMR